ncbi:MAG: TRAP transporter small permease [Spirochaetales bacterium]|nr:TRAP transporter small permease [Spirochaetales bacterium]
MKKIITGLEVFNTVCMAAAKIIVDISVAVQIVIIFCGVVWRYFLQSPLVWVDEFASLLLVVIAFLGCYLALSQNKLARTELFIGLFKGKSRKAVYIVSELFSLAMLAIVVYFGVRLFLMPTSLNQKTPGMYIPLWIFYGMIPFMFGLCIVKTVTKILRYIADGEGETSC